MTNIKSWNYGWRIKDIDEENNVLSWNLELKSISKYSKIVLHRFFLGSYTLSSYFIFKKL